MEKDLVGGKGECFTVDFSFERRGAPLRIMPFACGHELVCSPSYHWDGMRRGSTGMVVWQYTIAGRGEIEHAGSISQVNPGELMLVAIPHDHRYYLPRGSREWEFIFVCLNGGEALRLAGEGIKRFGPVNSLRRHSLAAAAARSILAAARQDDFTDPWAASAMAYELMTATIRELESARIETDEPEFVGKVTRFCAANVDRRLNIAKLAALSGYSRFHFSRLFKEHTGASPAEYLIDIRLRKARRLLQTQKFSVKQIASRCGFASSSYFTRAFRKRFGQSPREFREAAGKADGA